MLRLNKKHLHEKVLIIPIARRHYGDEYFI